MVVATGDSGAAGCDKAFQASQPAAADGLGVNLLSSPPEITALGGTQFSEGSGSYWSGANSPSGASAMSYIPEIGWNESGPQGLASTGGGLSTVFPKPSWQTGAGVPLANWRAQPDVALTSSGHDGYLVRFQDDLYAFGGTSAATPAFAGILAVLNQYQTANGLTAKSGQGNINPNLYRLAQAKPEVFHDITAGSNMVPCVAETPDCSGGNLGYNAGPGYDMVTGLGSVNAYNLVTEWSSQAVNSTTSVTADPASFGLNAS